MRAAGQGAPAEDAHVLMEEIGALTVDPTGVAVDTCAHKEMAQDQLHCCCVSPSSLSSPHPGKPGRSSKRAAEDSCAGGIHSPPGSMQTQVSPESVTRGSCDVSEALREGYVGY